MPRFASSVGRSLVVLPLALALAWTVPLPAGAAPPEATAAPAAPGTTAAPETTAAPADGAQPQPVADPTLAPAPVYQPQPQPMPQPSPVVVPNRNRGMGLMIAGLSVFTFSYLISAVAGAFLIDSNQEEVGRPLLIPLAGPFVAIGRTNSALAGLGLAFGGITQLAGLGMAAGGGVMLARSRRKAAQISFTPGGMRLRF